VDACVRASAVHTTVATVASRHAAMMATEHAETRQRQTRRRRRAPDCRLSRRISRQRLQPSSSSSASSASSFSQPLPPPPLPPQLAEARCPRHPPRGGSVEEGVPGGEEQERAGGRRVLKKDRNKEGKLFGAHTETPKGFWYKYSVQSAHTRSNSVPRLPSKPRVQGLGSRVQGIRFRCGGGGVSPARTSLLAAQLYPTTSQPSPGHFPEHESKCLHLLTSLAYGRAITKSWLQVLAITKSCRPVARGALPTPAFGMRCVHPPSPPCARSSCPSPDLACVRLEQGQPGAPRIAKWNCEERGARIQLLLLLLLLAPGRRELARGAWRRLSEGFHEGRPRVLPPFRNGDPEAYFEQTVEAVW